MSHSFEIAFDDPRRKDKERTRRLDIVISPIDDFTGHVVRTGVSAVIRRQSVSARRSLSGHLVFERLIKEADHIVHIDPRAAGYFVPEPVRITMPQDRGTRNLRLIRRPEKIVDGSAMVVRGTVERQGTRDLVEGQRIEGRIAGLADPFRTITNERGNFALRLRSLSPALGADPVPLPIKADVTLSFVGAGIEDIKLVAVEDLRTRVLEEKVRIP